MKEREREVHLFYSYDKVKLGLEIKKIRNEARISRQKASTITGVSTDTIRRIEKGEVIPRYDTLLKLSEAYKKDLISFMSYISPSYELNQYYQKIDRIIISNDVQQLDDTKEKLIILLRWIKRENFCNQKEIEQLLTIVSALQYYYLEMYNKAFEISMTGLGICLQDFELKEIELYRYSLIEKRFLIIISNCYVVNGNFQNANMILLLLHNSMIDSISNSENETKILLKITLNIAYNYHRMSKNLEALNYCNIGISICVENNLSYLMGHFIFRKGIAEYFLGVSRYEKTLFSSIVHLHIYGMTDLARKYIESLKINYNILIDDIDKYTS